MRGRAWPAFWAACLWLEELAAWEEGTEVEEDACGAAKDEGDEEVECLSFSICNSGGVRYHPTRERERWDHGQFLELSVIGS